MSINTASAAITLGLIMSFSTCSHGNIPLEGFQDQESGATTAQRVAKGEVAQDATNPESNQGNAPAFITDELSSDRHNGLPDGTLQIAAYYDGDSNTKAKVSLECKIIENEIPIVFHLVLKDIIRSNQYGEGQIATGEYKLNGCKPTGNIEISGVIPDGIIDGVAVGAVAKISGRYYYLKSAELEALNYTKSFGIWPIQLNERNLMRLIPQIENKPADDNYNPRSMVQTMLFGAQLLNDGKYFLQSTPALPAAWIKAE